VSRGKGIGSDLAAVELVKDLEGNIVCFDISLFSPTLKVPSFSIIAIIRKPEFRPDQVNEFIIHNNSAIVVNRHMSHRPIINTAI